MVYLRLIENFILGFFSPSVFGEIVSSEVSAFSSFLLLFLLLLLPLKILHKQAKLQGPIPPEKNSAGCKNIGFLRDACVVKF